MVHVSSVLGCQNQDAKRQEHDTDRAGVHAERCKFSRTATRAARERLLIGSRGLGCEARRNDRLQEGHHGAKFRAKLFDRGLLFGFASGQEVRAALVVFFDPFFGEAAVCEFQRESVLISSRVSSVTMRGPAV